ncbi:MAG: RNA polymerase factor sigma-54 [Coriobacteriia bacterium]|nr:RNA polymerase factor sigma-54 [Coriobacteriia bacterium]
MELQQRLEARQKITLSPQVYQGLSILAMPVADLQQLIEAEMLENPVLEVDDTDLEPADGEADSLETEAENVSDDDCAWDEWLEMCDDLESMEISVSRDPNAEWASAEELTGGIQSFSEYLAEQLALYNIPGEVALAARAVIGLLDEDGFFTGTVEEIARVAGVSTEVAAAGVTAVQQLDPPGVGAPDFSEALCLQMCHLGIDEPVLLTIIKEYLDDVAANRYRKIARALKIGEEEVSRLVGILRMLNPRPAGAFSPGPSPGYLVPDITIRRFDDEWLISYNNEAVPVLRVSSGYRSMLKGRPDADDGARRYLKEKIRAAESFIKNVDRRKDTISKITKAILETQQDFFENGTGPLRPLRLEDVAVEIGVHLSTVSRGVTDKYMATPYGLFELKYFFSGGYRTATGMDVAATSIKQRISEIIGAEDSKKPLSDQKLAEQLISEGVQVARRTVAKYREELGIEPSWTRCRK